MQLFFILLGPTTVIANVIANSASSIGVQQALHELDMRTYIANVNFDIGHDENVWSSLLASASVSLYRVGLDQVAVQRCMASRNLSDAKSILTWRGYDCLQLCLPLHGDYHKGRWNFNAAYGRVPAGGHVAVCTEWSQASSNACHARVLPRKRHHRVKRHDFTVDTQMENVQKQSGEAATSLLDAKEISKIETVT
ncbi:hypothetical protein MTO96_052407 [Rhipicephalus appendiculatus]